MPAEIMNFSYNQSVNFLQNTGVLQEYLLAKSPKQFWITLQIKRKLPVLWSNHSLMIKNGRCD